MTSRRKRLYTFAAFALLAMGSSAALKPGPISFFPSASAEANDLAASFTGDSGRADQATVNAQDHTEATEIFFNRGSAELPRDQEESLLSFLRGAAAKSRIRELKVIVYAEEQNGAGAEAAQELARQRLAVIREALAREQSLVTTYQIFPERSSPVGVPGEKSAADILAVLE